MRQYRKSLAAHGQVSPLFLSDLVQPHLREGSYADVGCGAGVPVSIFRARWPWTPAFIEEGIDQPYFVGIDFSPRAVAYAERYGAYDKVLLADSSAVPLADGDVDVALSLENLEHLYPDEVVPAIKELARIATRSIVITTPWPWDVVHWPWITQEVVDAEHDPDVLGSDEFQILAGCVHKSALFPEQMAAAGFVCTSYTPDGEPTRHPVYVANRSEVDPDKIGTVLGVARTADPGEPADFRSRYLALLRSSIDLGHQLPRPKRRSYRARIVARARRMRV